MSNPIKIALAHITAVALSLNSCCWSLKALCTGTPLCNVSKLCFQLVLPCSPACFGRCQAAAALQ